MTIFPVSVKAARANAGLTQTELAQALGVTKTCVVTWEKHNRIPKRGQVLALSSISGIPADCIFMSMGCQKDNAEAESVC